tara:strand:+ start:120 stop:860 length:741 start_codon:yes stop_codon:yes gene_type:complete
MEAMTPEEEARVEFMVQSAIVLEQAQSAMVQKIAVTVAMQETEERMAAKAAKAATEAAARAKSETQRAVDEAVAAATIVFEQEKRQGIDAALKAVREESAEHQRIAIAGATHDAKARIAAVGEAASTERESAIAEAVSIAVAECEERAQAQAQAARETAARQAANEFQANLPVSQSVSQYHTPSRKHMAHTHTHTLPQANLPAAIEGAVHQARTQAYEEAASAQRLALVGAATEANGRIEEVRANP